MESSPQKTWRAAAEKLASADFLLIATGAGFSADSSLPVYADIAKVDAYEKLDMDYQDLCDPYMLEQDEELFYGFWGSWTHFESRPTSTEQMGRDHVFKRLLIDSKSVKLFQRGGGAFRDERPVLRLHFKCTVDSHFKRDFDCKEVYELHGSVETWQCAGDVETGAREPCEKIWKLPLDFRFDLDVATMKAPGAEATTCPECGGKGRPNVLMFHDRQWIANRSEEDINSVVSLFVFLQMLQEDPTLNLVVLEIGCGTRIPTCDNPLILVNNRFLPIQSKGLEALEAIDRELANLDESLNGRGKSH
ncbi:DHS-like NAD/FAD-binding domain [Phytophthora cactorum]|nr:DHS-like NAD/FAD-binding domain [Phytophthora cactorum]